MSTPSNFRSIPVAAVLVLLATAAAVPAEQPCEGKGLPPEAVGDWRSTGEPTKLLHVEETYFREYTPERGPSSTPVLGASSCVPAVFNKEGVLEPLSLTINDGQLVLRRGDAREEYVRLSETPSELRLDTPTLKSSRELIPARIEEIRSELKRRHEEDQACLKANLAAASEDKRDCKPLQEENIRYLRALLSDVGWIDADIFGDRTTYHTFMVLQHSGDLGLMLAAAPYIERDLKDGDYAESYALFFDRLQVNQGKPQRYGTQIMRLPNGDPVIFPMEDPEHVDERRRSLGLPALDDYLDVAAKYLFDGKRPQHYDLGVVSAALSAEGAGDSQ